MVLLDFIRYHKNLTGTKIGCREGDCGACTVLVGEFIGSELRYRSATSCLMPIGNAQGKHIVTIEGLNTSGLNLIQQAMADEGGTQCGFCTPGFIVSLAGFCLKNVIEDPRKEVIHAIDGNICRCTGYKSIERVAFHLADLLSTRSKESPTVFAARNGILPAYFATIIEKLTAFLLSESFSQNGKAADFSEAILTGGGTDLYVQRHDSMTHAKIRFMSDVQGLKTITSDGKQCFLGASVTVSDLMESPIIQEAFPEFAQYAALISSTPIRNMATIAGNFVNASPIGDFTAFFLALDATITLNNGTTTRNLLLNKFYKGYKSLDKTSEEIIESISFEFPDKDTKFNFEKVSKRTNLDIASVNTAMKIKLVGDKIISASISAGGVGPIPMYLSKTAAFLANKIISEEVIRQAIDILQTEISPISDVRGTEMYKRMLLGQLFKAHFIKWNPELMGKLIHV